MFISTLGKDPSNINNRHSDEMYGALIWDIIDDEDQQDDIDDTDTEFDVIIPNY